MKNSLVWKLFSSRVLKLKTNFSIKMQKKKLFGDKIMSRIAIHEEKLDLVNSFKYVGVMVSADGKSNDELEARIATTGRHSHAMDRGGQK